MCGINSMVLLRRNRTEEELRLLYDYYTEALVLTQARGTDATGIAIVQNDGKVVIRKGAVEADAWTFTDSYRNAMQDYFNNNTTMIVGHTRASTSGTPKNPLNNHPFYVGNVIGVHNGTVDNEWSMWNDNKDLKERKQSECDSEVIFQLLNRSATDRLTCGVVKEALVDSGMRGKFALNFLDRRDPYRLHLIRQERPLWYVFWKEMDVILINSQKEFIVQALNRVARSTNLWSGEKLMPTLHYVEMKKNEYVVLNARHNNVNSVAKMREIKIQEGFGSVRSYRSRYYNNGNFNYADYQGDSCYSGDCSGDGWSIRTTTSSKAETESTKLSQYYYKKCSRCSVSLLQSELELNENQVSKEKYCYSCIMLVSFDDARVI